MTRITAENISKEYKLYSSPKDRLFSALGLGKQIKAKSFSALKNVSLTIPDGAFAGIIGRNGAGKSTLLKILAGITAPTAGNLSINGRRAALLELGGGFNPEFTGLQNVYFASSCMGYSKEQVTGFLPEILDFAEIGDFINQPVKTYSSGMYVRLAFAVAVNVDPDILILDEVMAVGDIRFQQKCIRKIKDFQNRGKTIVFVTHDTGAVRRFCTEAFWLENGTIIKHGEPERVVREYIAFMNQGELDTEAESDMPTAESATLQNDLPWISTDKFDHYGKKGAVINSAALCFADTLKSVSSLSGGELLDLHMRITASCRIRFPIFGFTVKDRYGSTVLEANTSVYGFTVKPLEPGETRNIRLRFTIPLLRNGEFSISTAVAEGTQSSHIQQHWVHDVITVTIENTHQSRSLGAMIFTDDISYTENQ